MFDRGVMGITITGCHGHQAGLDDDFAHTDDQWRFSLFGGNSGAVLVLVVVIIMWLLAQGQTATLCHDSVTGVMMLDIRASASYDGDSHLGLCGPDAASNCYWTLTPAQHQIARLLSWFLNWTLNIHWALNLSTSYFHFKCEL